MASPSPRIAGRANRAWRRRPSARASTLLLCLAVTAGAVRAETVFERLYPAAQGGIALPYPFARLVDDVKARTGAEVQLGFVPLGRSLQRYAADPDYFTSPRILLAVIGNGAQGPALRDRLFMGYQPAARAIEIIAFDETEGRFRFTQIDDYGPQGRPVAAELSEDVCATCHQSRAPIFSASPWDETNANPRIAAALPASIEGLAIHQDFDGLDQFARSVTRANRLLVAKQLKSVVDQSGSDFAKAFPQGLAVIEPKIPNRDPLGLVASGVAPDKTLETSGAFAPETPRPSLQLWKPGLTAAEDAARLIEEAELP